MFTEASSLHLMLHSNYNFHIVQAEVLTNTTHWFLPFNKKEEEAVTH